jgi:hypothetical protein
VVGVTVSQTVRWMCRGYTWVGIRHDGSVFARL